jgi:hypothetical protein
MEVLIKNHLLSKGSVNKIAFNHHNNILACVADGSDSILFFLMKVNGPNRSNIDFVELFVGDSKPTGSKSSIAWSLDGRFLALGLNHIELWSLNKNKLAPLKNYNEDFIDIKMIAWSPDSTSYCIGGLNKQNSIKIRNIESGKYK